MINSFKYAINGIICILKSERNIKIHFIFMFTVILLGLILNINIYEWFVCLILFAVVISGELFNSVIERCCDFMTLEKNDKIKDIKDIAAGAVLIRVIFSIIIGLIIFIPKILVFIKI